jgi:hypothetical protein
VGADSEVDAGVERGLLFDGAEGEGVVGIYADEEVVVGVADGGEVVFEHAADRVVFVPEGDEDGDGALGGAAEGSGGGPGEADAGGGEPDQGDEEVVQTADQDPDRYRYQERGDPVVEPLKRNGRK